MKVVMSDPAEKEETKRQTSWRFLIFAILNLIVFWSSWPLMSTVFPQFSAGLQFCLAAILPMVFLFVSAPIFLGFRRTEHGATKEDGTREVPAIVMGVLFVTIVVGMASWFPSAYIETNALSQPDHAIGQYTVPTHLKGVVRYLTPAQAMIDKGAGWMFCGSLVLALGLVAVNRLVKKNGRR